MKYLPDPASYSDKRLFALDFLRGADMLVLVAWCAIGRAIGRAYELGPGWMGQFQHPWIGFTLWDFIQPLFMFVVGAAVPLALAKRLTDIWKFRRGTGLVLLWGQCALFAYFTSHVFAASYQSIAERCLQGLPRLIPDARLVSVLNAVGSMAVLTFFMVVWRRFRAVR